MHSTALYNLSTAGYVFSLAVFAVHLVNTKKLLLRMGVLVVALSFLVQTVGLVMRWSEAGLMEVLAAEKALGQSLSGWSWFVVFSQHPPWSNLYEIMIYMSWGIVMVTLAAELKWRLAFVRQLGIILALMALGMAALTDASIKPLVPALKSWWIMIHVISASVAYAAGSIAACICLFALMKDDKRVNKMTFFACACFACAVLIFSLAGGAKLFLDQAYYVKLLGTAGASIIPVMDMTQQNGVPYLVPMPGVGILLLLAIVIHVGIGIVFLTQKHNPWWQKKVATLFALCVLSTVITLGVVLFHDSARTMIAVNGSFAHHLAPAGPWFISFKSHTWSFGLLVLVVIIEAFLLLYVLRPGFIVNRLPAVSSLENASYKAIALSFFLMTVVLITGALWAHYAWGRYWAWDPKETGALAIWLNYAIYLHTRRTKGLSGPFSSTIGVLGFFVIIIGFLGVNLGLFADGLHTYGNS